MKFIIGLLSLVSVTVTLDIKSVKPLSPVTEFRNEHPEIVKKYNSIDSDISNYIVGGEIAGYNQFRYAAGIITHLDEENAWCSGTVISDQFILTAAHCTTNTSSVIVIVNAFNISNPLESGQQRIVSENIITHADFDGDIGLNDIALIKVPPLIFTDTFFPIRLPSRLQANVTFANQFGTVVGWGTTSDTSSSIQDVPSFARNILLSNNFCALNLFVTIYDIHICMSGENGRNPCVGDSGASITITEADGVTTQVGLFSFNSPLGCQRSRPSVYTRITSFFDWIEANSNVVIRSGRD